MSSKPTAHETNSGKFEDELKPGTQLLHGQYVIEKFLNNGGFGITYLAKDSLHRMVVIKECYPESICRRTASTVRVRSRNQVEAFRTIVDLFIEEARKLARLSHPNIVGVHQVFEDNDTAYMAMDFVEGQELLEIVESGKTIDPPTVERMVLRLLDAIEFIHHQGILHRDISPDNILIGTNGQPVLIDFGAARETVTRATRFLGAMRTVKDGYSPQEFYVTNADQFPSSDLYSLAASLYHVLTKEIPISAQERLAAIAGGDGDPYISIKAKVTGYPEPFLDAIDQALSVFPKNRVQSAAEWRAKITQSSVSRMTRGTVSQPVLAVDNGNVLEQFERSKPQSIIGGLRRPDDPVDAVDRAARVKPKAQDKPQPKAEDLKTIVETPKKSSNGLYLAAASIALVAALGGGALFLTGDPSETDIASEALSTGELIAEEPTGSEAPDAPFVSTNSNSELAAGSDDVTTTTAPKTERVGALDLAPLPWEVARQVGNGAVAEGEQSAQATNAPDAALSVRSGDDTEMLEELSPEASLEVAAVEAAPAAPLVRDASSVISGKALEFLAFADPSDPSVVQTSSGPASEHLKPGLRLVSVNGYPIATLDDFQRVANATTEYEIGQSVDVVLGIEDPKTGDVFLRDVSLPAVQQTMLLNGVSFQTSQNGDAWTTLVTTGTGQEQSDLQPGDRLVALMPNNELIDTKDALERVIEREIQDGNTQFNFAVNRNGTMWFATMWYGASAN